MDPNANSGANGTTDTSSVTAIKVQVVLDTTTEQLKKQFVGIQTDIEKDPIGLTFGVDKKTSKDAIIKGLQEILGNGTNITIGAGVDPNAGNKVKNQVKNATDAGQQVADKNKVKIKVQTDVDTDTKDKIRAYYKRVQQQVNQSIKIARLKKTNPNSKEYHDAVDIYREQKRDAAKLRSELGDKIPTYTRSANDYSKEAEIRRAGRFRVRDSLSSLEASQQRVAENTAKKNAKAVVDAEFNAKKSALFERAKEIGKARTQLETLERGTPAYNNAVKNLRDSKIGYTALRHELGDKVSTEEYSRLSEIFRQNDRDVQNARSNALTKAIEAANKNVVQSIANNAQEKLKTFYEQQRKAGTLEQASLTLANKNADSEELKAVSEQLERTKSVASALRDELSDLLPEEEIHKLTKFDQELEDSLTRIKGRIADQNVAKTQSEADARLAAVKKAKISEYNSELSNFKKLTLDSARLEGKSNSENELSFVNQQMESSLNNLNKLQTDLGDVLSENELDEIIRQYEKFESDLADEVTRIEAHYEDLKNARESAKATAEEKRQVKQTDDYTNSLATARNKYKDMSGVPSDVSDSLDNVDAQIKKLDTLKVGTQDYAEQLKVIGTVWADATRQMSTFDEAQKDTENHVKSMTEQALKWQKSISGNTEEADNLRKSIQRILSIEKSLNPDHSSDKYAKGVAAMDDAFIDVKASMSAYKSEYKNLESQATSTLTKIRKAEMQLAEANNTTFDNLLKGQPGYIGNKDRSFEGRIRELNEMDSQSEQYRTTLKGIQDDWQKISFQIQQALKSEEDLIKEAAQRHNQVRSKQGAYNTIQNRLNGTEFTRVNSVALSHFNNDKLNDGKTGKQVLADLDTAMKKLDENQGPTEFKATLSQVDDLLVQVRKHIDDALSQSRHTKTANTDIDKMENLMRTLYQYKETLHGFEGSKFEAEYNELFDAIKNGSYSFEEAQMRVSKFQNACHQAGLETETLGQKLSRLFKEHFQTAIAMAGVAMVKQGLREVYDNVLELDTAVTELKKVSKMTGDEMNEYLDRTATNARELGANISDLVSSTADWKRLGYTDKDSEELARVSALMANVGDQIDNATTASSYLISAMQGFGLVADDAERLLDCMNQIANTEPVSMNDLGIIMQKSSAAMQAAGNTYQETLSLAAAVNGVLQDSESSGTYLKTLSMYLRASKTDAENAGIATDGMASSVSELRSKLKQLAGVDIMKDDNTFKSTYQIMKELSEVWKDLSDTTQANITELISGKRGGQSTSALLNNFSVAEDAMKQALNSSGSAMRENQTYMDSLQAKLNQLDSAFQKFSTDLMKSDIPKFFVSLATVFVDGADSAVKFAGALPTLTAAISGVLSVMQMSGKLKNGAGKVNMPSYICCV